MPEGCSAVSSVSVTVTLQYRPDHVIGGLQAVPVAEGIGRFSRPPPCGALSRHLRAVIEPEPHELDHHTPPGSHQGRQLTVMHILPHPRAIHDPAPVTRGAAKRGRTHVHQAGSSPTAQAPGRPYT